MDQTVAALGSGSTVDLAALEYAKTREIRRVSNSFPNGPQRSAGGMSVAPWKHITLASA
jgi:hypothetical protein